MLDAPNALGEFTLLPLEFDLLGGISIGIRISYLSLLWLDFLRSGFALSGLLVAQQFPWF